ncbi:SGNH/GDSL hydrolase family protein [Paenibacillus sp. SYP-B3998]|uniref:SGNH/GDSL hydrolase family protein n=2 Tax=Paenibacillus sp. SYP-B3998 TaxID=2678564 RepID=A0A6G4A3W5_9BACL|nr:SGNH/GDSL hydrolase family protein [Paenibacillus sp. SYP-B3998]NEW08634.1 SGNH/GDSL hydrolase family protein [Paenibacillus sp. SYP-B3998]
MIGDSVTDCERARPVGEGLFGAIGKGYVSLVDGLLNTVYPELQIRTVNVGNNGDTVLDLKARWQTDVLDLKPDWLSVMIGINDVWRHFDHPKVKEKHVELETYERTLRKLVTKTLPHVKGIVLMTPFYIEPNPQDAMRQKMDQYGQAVKQIAEETGVLFVDTQKAFEPLLKEYYPAYIAWDRVHPNNVGHAVLAKAFLQAIDFQWK